MTLTPTSTIPTLPPELIDDIVGNLHFDKDSLSSCSLVCKAWLSSSRPHVFHTITLPRYELIVNLSSPNSGIAVYVRRLHIRDLGQLLPMWNGRFNTDIPDLSCLTNVESLRLEKATFRRPLREIEMQMAVISAFPRIRELELQYVQLQGGQLLDIVHSFPLLERLSLDSVPILGDLPHARPHLPSLRVLEIIEFQNDLSSWLTRPHNIDSLSLTGRYASQRTHSRNYVISMGASLRRLALEYNGSDLDLSHSTGLRSVKMRLLGRFMLKADIISLFEQLISSQVEEVDIHLLYMTPAHFRRINWDRVEHIFGLPHFPALRQLTFRLWHTGDQEELMTGIRNRLRGCVARGILRIIVGDPKDQKEQLHSFRIRPV